MSAEQVPESTPPHPYPHLANLVSAVDNNSEPYFKDLEAYRLKRKISLPDMVRSLEVVLGWRISDKYAEWASRESGKRFRAAYQQRSPTQG